MIEIVLFLFTGAAAGLAAGLLGIGGGLIIVPILFFIFNAQGVESEHVMHIALATSLATITVTSVSSTWAHHRRGLVLWPIVISLSPAIVLGAWLGARLASMLVSDILRPIFAVFELIVAIHLLTNIKPAIHSTSVPKTRALSGGVVIGGVSAIVGIGGGTLTVPFLLWHNITIRNAVASSAACGFPIAVAGTAAYIISGWNITGSSDHMLGYVHLPAFSLIIITSMLTAPIGASLAHRLSERSLRTVFAILLLLLSVKMLLS
jgi:uncharacterized membrane protein YfcA